MAANGLDVLLGSPASAAPASPQQAASNGLDVLLGHPSGNAKTTAPIHTDYGSPLDGMSGVGKALAGAGKSAVDLGHGITQLGAEALNAISPSLVSNQTVATLRANEDQRKKYDAPLMDTGAGLTGYVAGNLASMLIPAGGVAKGAEAANMARTANLAKAVMNPSTYKAAAAVGAGTGAIAPVGTDDSRLANTGLGALGGVVGNSLANAVGRVAQPFQQALSTGASKAVQTLENAGVPLDAAQRSGNAFLNRMRSSFSDNPVTLGTQRAFNDNQQSAFNRAALNTIGENSTEATPDVMLAAKRRIGTVFDDVAARNPIPYDNALDQSINQVIAGAKNELSDSQMGIINRQIDNVLDKAGTNNMLIDGKAYQNIKTSLDRIGQGDDKAVGYWAGQLKSTLDDALEKSAQVNNPGDFQNLQQARLQYWNLKNIEGTIDKDGNGNISPLRLSNVMGQIRNRNVSVYGQGNTELSDLAQAGRQLLPDKTPNSGTPARLIAQMLLPAAVGGAYGGVTEGDVGGIAKYAVVGAGVPYAAQKAMQNQALSRYLANGLNSSTARALLLAPNENDLIGGVARRLPSQLAGVLNSSGQ